MSLIGKRESIRISVFHKLFFVVSLTALVLNLLAALAFLLGGRPGFGPKIIRNVERYSRYIAEEFSNPEKREAAKKLVEDLGISVRIESGKWTWTNNPSIPSLASLPEKNFRPDPPFAGQQRRGGVYLILNENFQDGPAKIYIGGPEGPVLTPNFLVLVVILSVVSLVLMASYWVIRKNLEPIHALSKGVEAIATGNFAHRVPAESRDEFAQLAGAFNSMVVKVEEMIRARERLLLDVSHELRSPLGRAQIALELLEDEKATLRVNRELLEMEQMIHTLLESARYENGGGQLTLGQEDLVSVVTDIARLFETSSHRIEVKSSASGILFTFDAEKIATVVKNLVENAVKYSAPHSSIGIAIKREKDLVRVSVSDSGQGIPEEEIGRIFEPFYRVDKSRARQTGGYGLGLSLCRRIIGAHGGTIDARSEVGQGTTIEFTLPLRKSDAKSA